MSFILFLRFLNKATLSGFLYQIFIVLFQGLMYVAALFSPKIKSGVQGRRRLQAKLEATLPDLIKGRRVAWFHAASLGEFEQGRPVMEHFRKVYPGHFILLTFFSPSGYEIRKNYTGADYVCYLPIDTKSNAENFIRIVNPQISFFIKYEFWYNYLRELKMSGAYIFSFSTIFRPGQVFFKSYGGFYRKLLTYFDHILVQNEESVELLHRAGITHCSLAGDTRFDRVAEIAAAVKDLPVIKSFVGDELCLIAGSVWQKDMDVLIPALNALKHPLKVIIAPHEIKAGEIESWRNKLTGTSVLYSEYIGSGENKFCKYLFIDNIGMLSSLYGYGNMAFIGGSFGSGLHNILEAATFGLPVIFGNKGYYKFQEALDLVKLGGAAALSNSEEIVVMLEDWMVNAVKLSAQGEVCRKYAEERKGATQSVLNQVSKFLK